VNRAEGTNALWSGRLRGREPKSVWSKPTGCGNLRERRGILAKTDRIDAEVLCEFGNVMRPQIVTAATLEQEHLRELESQRRHLTHLLVMEQNRGARLSDVCVCKLNRRLIIQIKKRIDQLDLLIKEHIEQSQELSAKAKKLTSISGVGLRTAALLLAQLPELGELNRREVAALVGVGRCVTDSTWPRLSPHATTPSCASFICGCVAPENRPNSLSLPRCENF
jgi:transposase